MLIVELCRRLVLFEFGHYTVTLVARRPPPTRRPETLSGNQAITTILSRDVIHSITQVSPTMDPLYLFLKTPEDAGANFCIDQLVVKTMAQPAADKHPAPGQHCWDSTGHNSPALSLQFSLFLSFYLSISIPNI